MGKRVIPRELFSLHEDRAKKIRQCVMAYIKKHSKTDNPAILLSSGADSHLILFAALRLGKKPTLFSCTLAGHESQDFKGARNTAKLFGLKFVPVILPTDVQHLINYTKLLYDDRINPGLIVGKATAECTWPVAHALKAIKANGNTEVITGFGGDNWYCTLRSQKKLWLKGEYQSVLDKYLYTSINDNKGTSTDNWEGKDPQQVIRLRWMETFTPTIKRFIVPFSDPKLFEVMDGMDPINEGCRPIQKAPWRLAFWDEFEKARSSVYIHVPMQKGDSLIEEHFHKLLSSPLNTKGYKSTVGIYNDQLRIWRKRHQDN